jgi:uncharacterized protein YukJ
MEPTFVTCYEGNGMRDINMNSGESQGSEHDNRNNEDGAFVFYFRYETASSRWASVFIKFETQTLA